MSIISADEYLRKGHQVDLDFMNLDSAIEGVNQEGEVPVGDFSTWKALYADWQNFFHKNVETVPWSPWQDSSDFDPWLAKFITWQGKVAGWANSARAKAIVRAMPESPAVTGKKEENAEAAKPTPLWVYALLGTTVLLGAGYAMASAAKLGGTLR